MITPDSRYTKMFDYLSAADLPTDPEALVVFGRNDPRVAHAAGDLAIANLAEVVVITGGFGKDSGDLAERGFRSEAHFLGHELEKDASRRGFFLPEVHLDEEAKNGGDNARNSTDILIVQGYSTASVTAVAHATSLRRLAETLKFEGGKKLGAEPIVHRMPSAYEFDASNPVDQAEAIGEINRLADWPARGILGAQPDLPENLVDFANDMRP